MTTYTFKVPPTAHVGSYAGVCCASLWETYKANALWDYNRVRAHDGLSPVTRMPSGTSYARKVKP